MGLHMELEFRVCVLGSVSRFVNEVRDKKIPEMELSSDPQFHSGISSTAGWRSPNLHYDPIIYWTAGTAIETSTFSSLVNDL